MLGKKRIHQGVLRRRALLCSVLIIGILLFSLAVLAEVPAPPTSSPTNPVIQDPTPTPTPDTPVTDPSDPGGGGGSRTTNRTNSTNTTVTPSTNTTINSSTNKTSNTTVTPTPTPQPAPAPQPGTNTTPPGPSTPPVAVDNKTKLPQTQSPSSNTPIIALLAFTSLLTIVAIVLVVKHVRTPKPTLPPSSFQQGMRKPLGQQFQQPQQSSAGFQRPMSSQPQQMMYRSQTLTRPLQQPQQSPLQQQANYQDHQNVQALKTYLSGIFLKGYTIEQARPTLSGAGWTENDIQRALQELGVKR